MLILRFCWNNTQQELWIMSNRIFFLLDRRRNSVKTQLGILGVVRGSVPGNVDVLMACSAILSCVELEVKQSHFLLHTIYPVSWIFLKCPK